MGKQRSYPLATKIAAVVMVEASGGSVDSVARELGIPRQTLRQWCNGDRDPDALVMSRAKRGDMEQAIRDVVWSALGLAQHRAEDADFRALMTGVGIGVDKLKVLADLERPPPPAAAPSVTVNVSQTAINLAALTPDEQFTLFQLLAKSRGPDAPEPAGVPDRELPDSGAGPAEPVRE